MAERRKPEADDEHPPICPACGVTMGIAVDEDGATRYVCLECGFSDEMSRSWAAGACQRADRPARIHTDGQLPARAPRERPDSRRPLGACSTAKRAKKAALRATALSG